MEFAACASEILPAIDELTEGWRLDRAPSQTETSLLPEKLMRIQPHESLETSKGPDRLSCFFFDVKEKMSRPGSTYGPFGPLESTAPRPSISASCAARRVERTPKVVLTVGALVTKGSPSEKTLARSYIPRSVPGTSR
jgi:hypothetical protein